jgi:Zn-finger nucleic acid-binding protein
MSLCLFPLIWEFNYAIICFFSMEVNTNMPDVSTIESEIICMKCPICKDIALVLTERKGVEIDYCPQCRGVWLDRGELDKLMDIAAASLPAMNSFKGDKALREEFEDSGYKNVAGYRARRKKSWMNEIFD